MEMGLLTMQRLVILMLVVLMASLLIQIAIISTGIFFPSTADFTIELRYMKSLLDQAEFLNKSLTYKITLFWPLAPGARSIEISFRGMQPNNTTKVFVAFQNQTVLCKTLPCTITYEGKESFIYIKIYLIIEGDTTIQANPVLHVKVNRDVK